MPNMHQPPAHLLVQPSAQANAGAVGVKPRSGGRSQKMNKIFEKHGMQA